jgi:hypothetical protein
LAATPELEAYKRAINVTSVKAYLLHCKWEIISVKYYLLTFDIVHFDRNLWTFSA